MKFGTLILLTNIWAFDYEAKFIFKFSTGCRDDNWLGKQCAVSETFFVLQIDIEFLFDFGRWLWIQINEIAFCDDDGNKENGEIGNLMIVNDHWSSEDIFNDRIKI